GGRFGQPEAADELAGRHAGQVPVLLLFGPESADRRHRQRSLHGHEGAQSRVAGFEFEGGETVFDGRAAGAAVAFQVHAEQAEVAHVLDDLGREDRVLIPVGDIGADLRVHEGADALADLEFGLREETCEVEQIGWVGGGGGGHFRFQSWSRSEGAESPSMSCVSAPSSGGAERTGGRVPLKLTGKATWRMDPALGWSTVWTMPSASVWGSA